MYRPLPEGFYIADSGIEGQGLFTSKPLKKNQLVGIVRYVIRMHAFVEVFRTPLGGFGNHSEEPNCVTMEETPMLGVEDVLSYVLLYTLRPVEAGEEITWTYTLYDPKEGMS